MESFGINPDEEKKKSPLYGLWLIVVEVGIVFIIVMNIIFFLQYFKIIDLAVIFGN